MTVATIHGLTSVNMSPHIFNDLVQPSLTTCNKVNLIFRGRTMCFDLLTRLEPNPQYMGCEKPDPYLNELDSLNPPNLFKWAGLKLTRISKPI